MQLSSLLGGLGKSNTKVLEAPIRAIVHEVLREQGYASPAEVQSLRDEARELASRVDAALARVAALAAAPAPVAAPVAAPAPAPQPDPRVGELEARVAALSAEIAELRASRAVAAPAAPAVVAEAPAAEPLSAAPRVGCKVPGCTEGVRSKGFCSAHYQQFRRGTLKGFVGPDGTVEVGGRIVSVGAEHAGGRLDVEGSKVLVDGELVLELAS